MAHRAFSPLRFFRQSPAGLLQRFFESRAVFTEFQDLWADALEPQAETLASALANADERIRVADVVDLKFSTPGTRSRHMRFTANGGDGGDVRHWAVETLGGGRRGDFEVVGARLRFHPRPNGRRSRTLTCELSAPTRCSLRDDPVEVNARRCLQRWGICGG
jgi:hypothetical protein